MKVNKKTECLLYVVLGVFSGIIGSSIMIFIIYNYEYKKEFIKITISIVGLFATFGGAYLGAKISGNKNFLRKIRSTYLINRLDKSLIKKKKKNSYDLNNYRRAVVTLNQECKYIISITDLDSLSNIVAFEYDNIFKSIDQLSTFIGMHYAN